MVSMILKHTIEPVDKKIIGVTGLIRTLSVAEQKGSLVIYFLVAKDCKHRYEIDIRIVGTGAKIDFDYIEYESMGTVNLMDGTLMYHVFTKEIRTK